MSNDINDDPIYKWLREPDHAEHFNTQDLVDWMERRPIAAYIAAWNRRAPDLTPSPAVTGANAAVDWDGYRETVFNAHEQQQLRKQLKDGIQEAEAEAAKRKPSPAVTGRPFYPKTDGEKK